MSLENNISTKLNAGLAIEHLNIENESHMHSGPATDSHFKVTLVSEDFEGKRLVQRHQLLYKILADELAGPVHALSMHLFTQKEWQAKGETVMPSPQCKGGSKQA